MLAHLPTSDGEKQILGAPPRGAPKVTPFDIAALVHLDVAALRAAWRKLYRTEPPKKLSRDLLLLAVAWKQQERAYGGLDAPTKRALAGLTQSIASKTSPRKERRISLKSGARIVRTWGGQIHEVLVLEQGFLWRDKTWPSLSAIAREMTGTHWSGPRFFGLDRMRTGAERSGGHDSATDVS